MNDFFQILLLFASALVSGSFALFEVSLSFASGRQYPSYSGNRYAAHNTFTPGP